eukprot:TRINITY_DN13243_c0_g1_i2.p1 TRINITY_DN13243_c0_g1~~TRINITY_DN13243_c0_g1_i2.p1  ORF type:complete len:350 (+),score=113.38 TRINITY_DN13243_c0_g1_i2:90-1139(+)
MRWIQTSASASTKARRVTLIPGDGIGEEISQSVVDVFAAAQAPIEWEVTPLSTKMAVPGQSLLTDEVKESVLRNRVGLKGPLATPIGKGHKSLNLTLRKEFGLFANVRPCLSIPGLKTRWDDVDVVVIRENTEGEYCGIEHEVVPGIQQSIKVITAEASLRVAHHAFQHAVAQGRKKVTAVHKANIMRMSDGLFVRCCREAATRYPDIKFEEQTVDNTALMLMKNPNLLDVMVLPNLYGDIISDLCAGLIGGLGLTPSGNIGRKHSIFEAVHGSAPDIAGQDKANPTALLLSAVMMLRHLKMYKHADMIDNAILAVIADGKHTTGDIGGPAGTKEYTGAIIDHIRSNNA